MNKKIESSIENYQSCTDRELIDKLLSEDIDAAYYLIMVKYKPFLYSLIGKYLHKMHIPFTDDDLAYQLNEFYTYITTPTKIKKKNRFNDIKNKDDITAWLCGCYRNFSKNYSEYKKKIIPINSDFIDKYLDNSYFDSETETELDKNNNQVLMMKLIAFFKTLCNARDKYIVFTYLYYTVADEKNINLDSKIAAVLQKHVYPAISNQDVRKIQSKACKKAEAFFKK
jgi:hypothetical protein